jgi:hypothetical protein
LIARPALTGLAATDQDRLDHQSVLLDEVVLDQLRSERGAAHGYCSFLPVIRSRRVDLDPTVAVES